VLSESNVTVAFMT